MIQFFRTPWAAVSTVAALALMVSACNKGPQSSTSAATDAAPASPAVAIVNGTPISQSEYDVYVKSLLQGKPQTTLTPEDKAKVLDELITMQLVSAQGVKDGLENEPEIAARLQVLRMRVLADAAMSGDEQAAAGLRSGAALLGLKGLVFKSHGGADAFSFGQALIRAHEQAVDDAMRQIGMPASGSRAGRTRT